MDDSIADHAGPVHPEGLLGHGKGTRQIAEQLCLSVKTVETYRSCIKEKLGLASASELLLHASQWVNSRQQCDSP